MNSDPPARGGAGRGQGRKPLSQDTPTVPVSIKMTIEQKDKLQRLGGPSWVRERIDKAREPECKVGAVAALPIQRSGLMTDDIDILQTRAATARQR